MDQDIVYKIALSMIPDITADVVRSLEENGITLADFFTLNMPELESRLGPRRQISELEPRGGVVQGAQRA